MTLRRRLDVDPERASDPAQSESVLGTFFPAGVAAHQALPSSGRSPRLATTLPSFTRPPEQMADLPTDIDPTHATSAGAETAPRAAELGLTVTRILKTPLAALRASMESMTKNLDAADPRRELLSGALAEVTRLGRDVEALASYAAPRPLAPLVCSIEEILHGTVARLSLHDATRVTLARPAAPSTLVVDGPLLSTALAHLVRAALENSSDDVLLQARVSEGHTTFAVVSGGDPARLVALRMSRSHQEASLGLGLELARRDVARMGGEFESEASDAGRVCVRVHVPNGDDGRVA
jgi:two-component system, OmpR family, sensor kinase